MMTKPTLSFLFLLLAACSRPAELVVYCSLDQDLSEGIISDFEQKHNVEVNVQYDVERNKTVGLVSRIIAEADNPQADVYWNNEMAHTIRLKDLGLTVAYQSPAADGIPSLFIDNDFHYTGFAARARVIMYRTDIEVNFPKHLNDFLNSTIAKNGVMAQPLTGTTLSNFAYLLNRTSQSETEKWFTDVTQAGLSFASGNADAMRRVCAGDYQWCFTDTDDAAKAVANGYPVAIHYLDQGVESPGAMLIPNSICLLKGAEGNELAKQFIDFAVSADTEVKLANSVSRQIPLHQQVEQIDGMQLPGRDYPVLDIDWQQVAAAMDPSSTTFHKIFVR
ncbi:MAG: extracellular solute-binding protein [Planctomycetota bacterium]|jgi:iron(III) transport system substrate-binding protein|nr:extracellular solute-binding protein [Planctomycetota bacterium]